VPAEAQRVSAVVLSASGVQSTFSGVTPSMRAVSLAKHHRTNPSLSSPATAPFGGVKQSFRRRTQRGIPLHPIHRHRRPSQQLTATVGAVHDGLATGQGLPTSQLGGPWPFSTARALAASLVVVASRSRIAESPLICQT